MNPVSIIRKKRDGQPLDEEEIRFLIDRYTDETLPDYQMSAFLMAAYLNGLNEEESAVLTSAMLHSGTILDLSELPGRKVDKHSTGGVGDKLSLILAPIAASREVSVPMISGRGLGHTGGTLDKLESITGFTVDIPLKRFKEILGKHHLVMAGQTREVAPADRRLYALRDVTATVESIPLIASSIMSKKLAEGIDALVLDVKFGSGAFMENIDDALQLAETLVGIGEEFGKKTVAYLTSMEEPLGYAVGNWLEAREAVECLRGEGPEDVMEITHLLAGTMIWMGGKAGSVQKGVEESRRAVADGSAYDKWLDLVSEQGGDAGLLKDPDRYPEADHRFSFDAPQEGYINSLKAYQVGMASLELGAGRKSKESAVDPQAGILLKKKIGDFVKKGETIAVGFTNNNRAIEIARKHLADGCTVGKNKPDPLELITHKVNKSGISKYKT